MKRLIASVLSLAMLFALGACAPAQEENDEAVDGVQVEEPENVQPEGENTASDENAPAAEGEEEKKEEGNKGGLTVSGSTSSNKNDKTTSSSGGGLKVETEDVPVIEGEKVEIVPVTPAPEATQKPQNNQAASATVAQSLLKDFKSRANSGANAEAIANGLLSNSVIKFSGGVVPVEPGMLTGFDNAEIKGFSEGAMFAPMIGTIPFVGYVFTLAEGTNASDFVATLKKNANPRWNICTEAEETVAESVGNKVFFVMSPREMTE